MIPLSKDQKLKHTIDGVTYSFHPPIDEIEVKLQEYLNRDDSDLKASKALLPEARKQLEKEYKGRKIPKKEEWNEIIGARIIELMERDGIKEKSIESSIKESTDMLAVILCGWGGRDDIPEFNKEAPCQGLTLIIKQRLFNWYLTQYTTTEDELKN